MLSLKHLSVRSFNEHLVYINKNCTDYRIDNIRSITKVEIHGGSRPLFAFLQVIDDDNIVKPNEVGLNDEAFAAINLPEGSNVSLSVAPTPSSLSSIRRKISGNILSTGEYASIVNEIKSGKYANIDIATFLVAIESFMTQPELLSITEALIGDNIMHWDDENIVVDCHCFGGIPGNKTDLIVTPIVAAYGLPMPKTASHSLTSCAGVADTFAVLANPEIDEKTLRKCIRENRGAIASQRKLPITEANKTIVSVERYLGLNHLQYLAATILSIKISCGITHLLIDIPVGPKARVRNTVEGMHLRKAIEYIGDMLNIEASVVITDGSEPIGNGIGAVLEARDAMKILRNKEDAPQDLREKSLFLAGKVLEFDPNLRGGQGYHVAKEILTSGKALETMNKIIYTQGKSPSPQLGSLTRDIVADKSGVVESIDCQRINRIGLLAGCGQYPGAGLDLFKKTGDSVEEGETLYRVHSVTSTDFAFANSLVDGYDGYEITDK